MNDANPKMSDANKCPQCGTPLKSAALGGLCPACLLAQGAADTVTDAKQPSFHPPSVIELAALFPQLEILELIGKGGMGAVYKARQKELDRIVALKILPPGIGETAGFAERFTREAKALAKLNHPNIVTIYDFGRTRSRRGDEAESAQTETQNPPPHVGGYDELYYFLMEFVDGVNLRQLLSGERISPHEALAIVPQICDALQFAHDHGIVHRDIKPENILMDRRGRVKVADFGLAKIVGADAPLSPSLSPSDGERVAKPGEGTSDLTEAGKVMGTPHYMAPEQKERPNEVDHRADIYALGVVFYQMLTGELPEKQLQPPSKKVHIDVRLDEIVLRALEKKPELRYQQASAMKTQVDTIAATPDSGRRRGDEPQTEKLKSESPLTSSPTNQESRFSITAIVGACLGSLFIIPAMGLIMVSLFGKYNGTSRSIAASILPFFLLLGLPGILGMSVLGWIAVSQIRRSTGKLHGMWLAVFDGLLFPLLVLDVFIGSVGFFAIWALSTQQIYRWHPGEPPAPPGWAQHWWVGLLTVIIILVTDLLIIWFTVRAVNKTSAPPVQKPDRFWRWFTVTGFALIVVSVLIAFLGMVAAIALPNIVKAHAKALEQKHQTPPALTETWSPAPASDGKIDVSKILSDAKDLMEKGRYEESLQRQIWYFNHALEYEKGQTGVRLSSALSQWVELGRRYPKAKAALLEIRDRETRLLAEGKGYVDLFTDVQAINRELQENDATYELFKTIREKDPQLAGQCYFWVESLLVEKGEYQWCFDHMGDPESRFDMIRRGYEMQISSQKQMAEMQQHTKQMMEESNRKNGRTNAPMFSPPDISARIKKSAEDRFAGQTRQLIEILVATDHKNDAEKIQERALEVLNVPSLQSAVNDMEKKIGGHGHSSVFGPVIERMLSDSHSHELTGIDFDSGRVEILQFDQAITDKLFVERGVDAMLVGSPHAFSSLTCINDTFAMPVESVDWDNSNAEWVLSHATNIQSATNMTFTIGDENGVLPKTYIFRTRAKGMGILQITGFNENPRGVKIHYKLLQQNVQSSLTGVESIKPNLSLAWRSTKFVAPDFDAFFPDDVEGGETLDNLWLASDKNSRSDEEILTTVRRGLRRTKQHRTLILAWIGNRYIWGKSPQNPDAIEIMYHAAECHGPNADPHGTRHYAVYFGLSVVKPKTPAILRTLAEICINVDDPNDLDRIAWGAKDQSRELHIFLQPYLESTNAAVLEKARVVEKIISGEIKAFAWAAEKRAQAY